MPPRQTPKVFQILAKTHRLTIFLNAPHPTTIGALKTQALAALSQFQGADDPDNKVPFVKSVDDFEFCRATRERGKIVAFDVLDTKATVRDSLNNWEAIFMRFRNETGKLQDVQFEEAQIDDEEPLSPVVEKGKRKAPPA